MTKQSLENLGTGAWNHRVERAPDYARLGWVQNGDLLQPMIELMPSNPRRVLDVGMGTGVVTRGLSQAFSTAEVYGLDVDQNMIVQATDLPSERSLRVLGSIFALPFPDDSIDGITARMVLHHFDQPRVYDAVAEMMRVAKRVVVGEYVIPEAALAFEAQVFQLKEPERALLTERNLAFDLVMAGQPRAIDTRTALMSQYSVRDWLVKSGLPHDTQMQILELYLSADDTIVEAMNITKANEDGQWDALVDRQFAYVALKK